MAKMEYGFMLRGQYKYGDDMHKRFLEMAEQVRLADKLGYQYLFKGQHYGAYPIRQFQQFPFLTRMMAEGPNMKLVTGINLLSLHKPLDLAEQIASIDVMSGGKFIFGVGLGYREVEFKAFGTTQKERVPRFEENLEAIVRLWTEEHVSMKGSHFELDDVTPSIVPMQKPRPPIWMGANADSAVERAARLADTLYINPHQRTDTIERQMEVYKRALDKFNKPFPDVLPVMREIFVAKDRETALRLAKPYLTEKYKVYDGWGQQKAMPEGDNDLSMDFDELMRDRFLLGSPEEVAEQIIQYNKRLGANMISLGIHWVGMPHQHVMDTLHMFHDEVIPLVEEGL